MESEINWLISAGASESKSTSWSADVREMLPEDLIYFAYSRITERHNNVASIIRKMNTGTRDALIPGDVISVDGRLQFLDLGSIENVSPFESVEVELRTSVVSR